MKIYLDTEILIRHLRGDRRALHLFIQLSKNGTDEELWIAAIQRASLLVQMKPAETESTLLFLSKFKTAAMDQAVVDQAIQFYQKYKSNAAMELHHAILASTAALQGGVIFCLHKAQYPMSEVRIRKAW
jgi:predicted nucleic acid-binding protein